jgi:plastocyanin
MGADSRTFFAAVVLCVALVAAACSSDSEPPAGPPPPPPPPSASPVDPATAGSVAGTIRFEGTAPKPQPVNMQSDAYCADRNATATVQRVAVAGDGALQNVFVYVKDGLGNLRFPVPSTAVVLDQRDCAYTPRVFGIQVGQPLEILNSDSTLHNIHAVPEANREFNRGQANQGQRYTQIFSTAEVMVPFKCDVHRWMNAWVGVLDHPFFTVTGANGTFELKGLPPGTYTIEALHETLGKQTQTVTIGARQTGTVAFTFKASA